MHFAPAEMEHSNPAVVLFEGIEVVLVFEWAQVVFGAIEVVLNPPTGKFVLFQGFDPGYVGMCFEVVLSLRWESVRVEVGVLEEAYFEFVRIRFEVVVLHLEFEQQVF